MSGINNVARLMKNAKPPVAQTTRVYQFIEFTLRCWPDKAFTPHPAQTIKYC
ncbi:hypothetical protein C3999_01669 [Escherichia marmotae]|nr:hypothetical protein C4A10_01649 [Escherichia marmotae]RDR57929.1 hypothetical protein C4A06_01778 [Escherichia marmotae]RDR89451.1 hypothetical protein C3999_01669 [Escherichia marmotae]RDR89542.1 hypothetical protein C3998_01688 [Escherichia marmotae]